MARRAGKGAGATVEDVPGDVGTDAPLVTGTPVAGTIDEAGDQDWYRLTVTAGVTYLLELEGTATAAGTLPDPLLRLLDGSGNEIISDDDGGDGSNSLLGYTATSDGALLVSAEGWATSVGTYRLSARELADDTPGNAGTSATLGIGASVEEAVDFGGDQDWYRVELRAGRTYLFDLTGGTSAGAALPFRYLRLLEADGSPIEGAVPGLVTPEGTQLGFSPIVSGTYLISAEGMYNDVGPYRLSAREVPDDLPDNATTPVTLRTGYSVQSAIDFVGDVDWFRIDGKAGRTYVVDVAGLATLGGTLGDPAVTVDDAGGAIREHELEIFATGGWNDLPGAREWRPAFVIEAETSGAPGAGWSRWAVADGGNDHDYKVSYVGRNITWGEASGRATAAGGHLATIESAAEDAHVSGLVGAAGLEAAWIGGFQPSPATAAEPDGGWAWVTGEPFAYVNWAPRQPDNALWARDDALAVDNDDGGTGTDAQAGLRLGGQDGPIYVQVRGDELRTGTYSVTVREIAGDVGGDRASAAAIGVGARVTGTIDFADDRDWFRVDVSPGGTYVFDLEGAATGQGSLERPVLSLHGPDGSLLVADYSASGIGSNARITYTAAIGTDHFYLEASGSLTDDRGTYTLGVRADGGLPQTDLPQLVEGRALPEAAIQPGAPLFGDVVVTWLGGTAAFDSAIGIVDFGDFFPSSGDARLLFPSLEGLAPGASVTLEGISDGLLFLLPDGADRIPAIETLAPGELLFRSSTTGDLLRRFEESTVDLITARDGRLDELFFDPLFGTDWTPDSEGHGNGLNPDGAAHATSGRFERPGGQSFRVVAFEDLVGGIGNGDVNDAAIALSTAPLTSEDLAAVREYLFG